ncbi:hypothetical protein AMTRI_Chr11g150150 [Amborella trichopoda]
MFVLKITVQNELLDHIREATVPKEAWNVLVKSLCHEISKLDLKSQISETRMRRIIIRGLRPEYNGFMTAIKGWQTQPSLLELESLLENQDTLAKQMAGIFVKVEEEALFARKKAGETVETNQRREGFQPGGVR